MTALAALTLVAYALAASLYLSFVVAGERAARLARVALGVGIILHFADIGSHCIKLENPLSSAPDAMSFVAFMIAVGFLGASIKYRVAAGGAFIAPVIVVLFVLARLVPGDPDGERHSALGQAHIFLATLGVAIFALAAALAVLYLMQERQLKRRKFARVAAGGASLEILDRLAARCVTVGFPIFTIAIVTGAVWVARLGLIQGGRGIRVEYVAAVAAWLAFGVLVTARLGAGWRGRRAAWLTVGGFGGTLLVLLVYFLRRVV